MKGVGSNWESVKKSLRGQGTAEVRKGTLKDLNLVEAVLSQLTGLPGLNKLLSSRLPPRYAAVFKRRDTPFDELRTTFTIGEGRTRARNFSLMSGDYMIQGDGVIGFDRNDELECHPRPLSSRHGGDGAET